MKRREFLALPASAVAGSLLYQATDSPIELRAQGQDLLVPLRFFSAAEAKTVAAACERILPADENGPGAEQAGVAIYIDRQLAGPYGRDKYRYTKGPWRESVSEHGYQDKANPREVYRDGIEKLGNFADLPPAQQDERLKAAESTTFFQLLRTHTIEGMF